MMMTAKPKRVHAVFMKQVKDTFKNKSTLIQFVMFPLLSLIFTELIAKANPNLPDNYFNILFATIYTGFIPMVTMASIISEEKEKHTLKAMMMANVLPWQYLAGISSFVFLLCSAGSCVFGLIGGYSGMAFVRYMLVMLSGVLASVLLGATFGMLSKNQMTATALAMPVAMITAFLPMIAMFNDKFEKVARMLYTQQISEMLNDISASNLTMMRFFIVGMNLLVFGILFFITYKRKGISES